MLHVVLVEPEIAPNVGNVARTCLATGATLHLVHPLGFRLTDEALRRSGMDYWDEVAPQVHASFAELVTKLEPSFQKGRVFSLTTKGSVAHSAVAYTPGDVLLFGPESRGLPEAVRSQTLQLRLPMTPGTRSLNLAVSVGIAVYEAWRQLGYGGSRSI